MSERCPVCDSVEIDLVMVDGGGDYADEIVEAGHCMNCGHEFDIAYWHEWEPAPPPSKREVLIQRVRDVWYWLKWQAWGRWQSGAQDLPF